ncbi:ABC transporter substrate-binding protein [Salipiger aestuarii]|uniref:Peptide/nickel transport system permease protein n=1 Tax=Salipiger aestuarii TaxID=568098 RepID=A0A327YEW7_9RHOB|nr:ABC transporter permease [Salipiger aestuarii]EIE51658.1 ABC transporter, permease protein, putative [Citreicella sp. 357]KAA8609527.1 ABC transporter substrate-binding protein [Salipiger aestuarii]KAA8610968.1 ABC transporter substrate-binding protein [Salipiger aestuarii]KAB2542414.1 ABC transporter substrate-binding protein [Salipiger aestuarii]RAK18742.1 peptide/nickel transport system permease protein [Salipiger aestuarii]
MLTFAVRRLVLSIPTLLFISFVIFMLLQLAPGDPMSQVPLTVPPEVKEKMRQALGMGEPALVQYWKWLVQVFWTEPKIFIDWLTRDSTLLGWLPDTALYHDELRVISWQTRSPVMDIVLQRIPQTLWVVGLSYIVGILIALPIGVYSAYRQYSVFDQAGTFITMVGFSIPPFFTGPLLIVLFSVYLGWFPSIYDTTHVVNDWDSFTVQLRQMVMPVMVLALQTTAQLSRYMRASMLDNLGQDYVRTARAKGLSEAMVVMVHVLRNSMIPVVTVIALGVPAIFGGAIITENVFKVNGIGQLLLTALFANDLPMVMTLTFIFAFLIVLFNLIADVLYGLLDPRIRYD